jgi:two-component system, NtrC family, sensor histidine kinase GlrK
VRFRFPKLSSFLALVLLGFSLAVFPLALALVIGARSLEELARQSEQVVYRTLGATQSSRLLLENAADLERKARLLAALGEDSARLALLAVHRDLQRRAKELSLLPLPADAQEDLDSLQGHARALVAAVEDAAENPNRIAEVEPRFRLLHDLASQIAQETNALAVRGSEALQKNVQRAKDRLVQGALVLVLPTIALAWLLALLIAKPVRRIHQCIHRLGEADFTTPISISGPKDVEELGERLDWLRERLRTLENQKRMLLAHVSHELKTPLTAIREGSELLLEGVVGPLTTFQAEVAQIMHQNSLQLQKSIQDLLDLSIASARALPRPDGSDLQPVLLPHVIEEVLAGHRPTILKKAIAVQRHLKDVVVLGRGDQLRTLFDNLIGNAVKFTPEGGRLGVAIAKDEDGAAVDVWDTGPGIEPNERDRLFEPFFQGKAQAAGVVKGSGLGLSIAREYARAHGGRIELLDGSDGAHFRVRLPLPTGTHAG